MFEFTFTPAEAQLAYGYLASLLAILFTSLAKRPGTPRSAKIGIAIGISIVLGILSQYAAGQLSGGSAVVAAIGVFLAAQAQYIAILKDTPLDATLEAVGS